ncbi:hypothetical protein GCM10010469_08010 [Streptomyces labedae]|uniref:Uncharacterized protein n=2 Tax=Streptomyces TaxID=1883 RepID=A0ABQ2U030_9ACTN|nr:hypothetical protein GCM10010265_47440 [Streptomyces griseoincarnatus]GGT51125.1 hypothetical protein GCM10010287_26390 [Streptomyces variabilis]
MTRTARRAAPTDSARDDGVGSRVRQERACPSGRPRCHMAHHPAGTRTPLLAGRTGVRGGTARPADRGGTAPDSGARALLRVCHGTVIIATRGYLPA